MHGMSNLGSNDYNDLAYLLHYAPFPITDSEHHDTKWGNQLPPTTPARPRPREAACLVGWSNLIQPKENPSRSRGQVVLAHDN